MYTLYTCIQSKFSPSTMEQTLSRVLRMYMYRVLPEESRATRRQLTTDAFEVRDMIVCVYYTTDIILYV